MTGLPLGAMVAVFAGFLVVLLLILRALPSNERLNKRLKNLKQKPVAAKAKTAGGKSKLSLVDRKAQSQKGEFLFRTLGTDSSMLKQKIKQAGLTLSIFEIFIIYMLASIVMSFIIYFVSDTISKPLLLLYTVPLGCVIAFLALRFWIGLLANIRVSKFNDHFPDALELMVRCLRTGIPINEMFQQVSTNSPQPVSGEFERIYNDIRFGIPLGEAIWRTAERMPTQEFLFFAVSVSIQSETGGNLAENLEKLANVLRNRMQVKRMIKTKSAEARLTAKILTGLPFAFVGGLQLLSPDYLDPFLQDERGNNAGIIICGMILVGIYITNKMTKFGY